MNEQEFKKWWSDNEVSLRQSNVDKGYSFIIWLAATRAERERCAKIAESCDDGGENHQYNNACTDIAKAIRGA